jgi:hypothetical protein
MPPSIIAHEQDLVVDRVVSQNGFLQRRLTVHSVRHVTGHFQARVEEWWKLFELRITEKNVRVIAKVRQLFLALAAAITVATCCVTSVPTAGQKSPAVASVSVARGG